jgi:thioredoxin 1
MGRYQVPTVTAVTDWTFDARVLKVDVPVLAAFCTTWEDGCIAVHAWMEDLAASSPSVFRVAIVDVDGSVGLTSRYQIIAVPTLVLFKNGMEVLRVEGTSVLEAARDRILPLLDGEREIVAG